MVANDSCQILNAALDASETSTPALKGSTAISEATIFESFVGREMGFRRCARRFIKETNVEISNRMFRVVYSLLKTGDRRQSFDNCQVQVLKYLSHDEVNTLVLPRLDFAPTCFGDWLSLYL